MASDNLKHLEAIKVNESRSFAKNEMMNPNFSETEFNLRESFVYITKNLTTPATGLPDYYDENYAAEDIMFGDSLSSSKSRLESTTETKMKFAQNNTTLRGVKTWQNLAEPRPFPELKRNFERTSIGPYGLRIANAQKRTTRLIGFSKKAFRSSITNPSRDTTDSTESGDYYEIPLDYYDHLPLPQQSSLAKPLNLLIKASPIRATSKFVSHDRVSTTPLNDWSKNRVDSLKKIFSWSNLFLPSTVDHPTTSTTLSSGFVSETNVMILSDSLSKNEIKAILKVNQDQVYGNDSHGTNFLHIQPFKLKNTLDFRWSDITKFLQTVQNQIGFQFPVSCLLSEEKMDPLLSNLKENRSFGLVFVEESFTPKPTKLFSMSEVFEVFDDKSLMQSRESLGIVTRFSVEKVSTEELAAKSIGFKLLKIIENKPPLDESDHYRGQFTTTPFSEGDNSSVNWTKGIETTVEIILPESSSLETPSTFFTLSTRNPELFTLKDSEHILQAMTSLPDFPNSEINATTKDLINKIEASTSPNYGNKDNEKEEPKNVPQYFLNISIFILSKDQELYFYTSNFNSTEDFHQKNKRRLFNDSTSVSLKTDVITYPIQRVLKTALGQSVVKNFPLKYLKAENELTQLRPKLLLADLMSYDEDLRNKFRQIGKNPGINLASLALGNNTLIKILFNESQTYEKGISILVVHINLKNLSTDDVYDYGIVPMSPPINGESELLFLEQNDDLLNDLDLGLDVALGDMKSRLLLDYSDFLFPEEYEALKARNMTKLDKNPGLSEPNEITESYSKNLSHSTISSDKEYILSNYSQFKNLPTAPNDLQFWTELNNSTPAEPRSPINATEIEKELTTLEQLLSPTPVSTFSTVNLNGTNDHLQNISKSSLDPKQQNRFPELEGQEPVSEPFTKNVTHVVGDTIETTDGSLPERLMVKDEKNDVNDVSNTYSFISEGNDSQPQIFTLKESLPLSPTLSAEDLSASNDSERSTPLASIGGSQSSRIPITSSITQIIITKTFDDQSTIDASQVTKNPLQDSINKSEEGQKLEELVLHSGIIVGKVNETFNSSKTERTLEMAATTENSDLQELNIDNPVFNFSRVFPSSTELSNYSYESANQQFSSFQSWATSGTENTVQETIIIEYQNASKSSTAVPLNDQPVFLESYTNEMKTTIDEQRSALNDSQFQSGLTSQSFTSATSSLTRGKAFLDTSKNSPTEDSTADYFGLETTELKGNLKMVDFIGSVKPLIIITNPAIEEFSEKAPKNNSDSTNLIDVSLKNESSSWNLQLDMSFLNETPVLVSQKMSGGDDEANQPDSGLLAIATTDTLEAMKNISKFSIQSRLLREDFRSLFEELPLLTSQHLNEESNISDILSSSSTSIYLPEKSYTFTSSSDFSNQTIGLVQVFSGTTEPQSPLTSDNSVILSKSANESSKVPESDSLLETKLPRLESIFPSSQLLNTTKVSKSFPALNSSNFEPLTSEIQGTKIQTASLEFQLGVNLTKTTLNYQPENLTNLTHLTASTAAGLSANEINDSKSERVPVDGIQQDSLVKQLFINATKNFSQSQSEIQNITSNMVFTTSNFITPFLPIVQPQTTLKLDNILQTSAILPTDQPSSPGLISTFMMVQNDSFQSNTSSGLSVQSSTENTSSIQPGSTTDYPQNTTPALKIQPMTSTNEELLNNSFDQNSTIKMKDNRTSNSIVLATTWMTSQTLLNNSTSQITPLINQSIPPGKDNSNISENPTATLGINTQFSPLTLSPANETISNSKVMTTSNQPTTSSSFQIMTNTSLGILNINLSDQTYDLPIQDNFGSFKISRILEFNETNFPDPDVIIPYQQSVTSSGPPLKDSISTPGQDTQSLTKSVVMPKVSGSRLDGNRSNLQNETLMLEAQMRRFGETNTLLGTLNNSLIYNPTSFFVSTGSTSTFLNQLRTNATPEVTPSFQGVSSNGISTKTSSGLVQSVSSSATEKLPLNGSPTPLLVSNQTWSQTELVLQASSPTSPSTNLISNRLPVQIQHISVPDTALSNKVLLVPPTTSTPQTIENFEGKEFYRSGSLTFELNILFTCRSGYPHWWTK